jgi:predicted esterase
VLGPEDDPAAIRDVWFVLHGYGQLAATFVRFFAALDDGTRLIVAPEALNRFYLIDVAARAAADRPVGATWMTREDREHEIRDYVGYLDALWEALSAKLPKTTPRSLTVLGFSQGAATAARWVAFGGARPARLVLWGGLLPPDIELTGEDHALRCVALQLVIGTQDGFVTDARIAEERARLAAAGIEVDILRYRGGHGIKRETLMQLAGGRGARPNE